MTSIGGTPRRTGFIPSDPLAQEWAMPALAGEKIITVALNSETGEGPSNSVWPHMELQLRSGALEQGPCGPLHPRLRLVE